MSKQKYGVGIVGLQAGRSWAAFSHLPALRYLADDFELVGVANSTHESAKAAAAACGIPRAFEDLDAMVASPDVDIVAVTVRVPAHLRIVQAALSAGKHVYCEWPLGRTLDEADALTRLARERQLVAVAGTQARVSPAMQQLRRLIDGGYVGTVLSTSITGWGRVWGATVDDLRTEEYLLRNANGATLLTIPFAHTVAAVRDVLGDLAEVSAVLDTRRTQVLATESGAMVPMDAPDQILIAGRMASGAPISIHYQGGEARGVDGFVWDIHGTDGDLRVTGPSGHTQLVPLSIAGARGTERTLQPLAIDADNIALPDAAAGNVARMYRRMAADLRHGTQTAATFDDALALHRVVAAIEQSAQEGRRVGVTAANRVLP